MISADTVLSCCVVAYEATIARWQIWDYLPLQTNVPPHQVVWLTSVEQCQLAPEVHLLPHLYITVPDFFLFLFIFFSSQQVKRSCDFAGFIWEMTLKLIISWWLLLNICYCSYFKPFKLFLILLSELGCLTHSQYNSKKNSFIKTLNVLRDLDQTWCTVTLDDLIMYRSGSCSSEQSDGQTNAVSEKGKVMRQAKGCSVKIKHFTVGMYLQKHFSYSTVMFFCFKTLPIANAQLVYYRHCVGTTLEKITMFLQPV